MLYLIEIFLDSFPPPKDEYLALSSLGASGKDVEGLIEGLLSTVLFSCLFGVTPEVVLELFLTQSVLSAQRTTQC